MNKTRLTKNRLTIQWTGISKIIPVQFAEVSYKRFKFRENRKGVINDKKHINDEND